MSNRNISIGVVCFYRNTFLKYVEGALYNKKYYHQISNNSDLMGKELTEVVDLREPRRADHLEGLLEKAKTRQRLCQGQWEVKQQKSNQ